MWPWARGSHKTVTLHTRALAVSRNVLRRPEALASKAMIMIRYRIQKP